MACLTLGDTVAGLLPLMCFREHCSQRQSRHTLACGRLCNWAMLCLPFRAFAARPPFTSGTVSSASCATGLRGGLDTPVALLWCPPLGRGWNKGSEVMLRSRVGRCRCCFKTCVKPKISNQFRQLSSRTATCDSGEGRRLVEAPRASASAFLFSPLLVGSSAASAFPGSALPPSAGGGWPFGRTTLAAPPPRPAKIV